MNVLYMYSSIGPLAVGLHKSPSWDSKRGWDSRADCIFQLIFAAGVILVCGSVSLEEV